MTRREEFIEIIRAFKHYEGQYAGTIQFLIEYASDLEIALERVSRAKELKLAQEVANRALEREPLPRRNTWRN